MKPRTDWVHHEAAHVAAAMILRVPVAGVTFHDPFYDGVGGLTWFEDSPNRTPLNQAVISYAPVFVASLGTDWWSPEFGGDREIAERVMPAHWLSTSLWFPHVADKAKELLLSSGRFRPMFADVAEMLQDLEVTDLPGTRLPLFADELEE